MTQPRLNRRDRTKEYLIATTRKWGTSALRLWNMSTWEMAQQGTGFPSRNDVPVRSQRVVESMIRKQTHVKDSKNGQPGPQDTVC